MMMLDENFVLRQYRLNILLFQVDHSNSGKCQVYKFTVYLNKQFSNFSFVKFSYFVLFVKKLYFRKCFTFTKNKLRVITSKKLIMPCKSNEIGKIQNSKLYKPQTKNCTTWTRRKFCTYMLFTVRFLSCV